jgi:hypothetical protein
LVVSRRVEFRQDAAHTKNLFRPNEGKKKKDIGIGFSDRLRATVGMDEQRRSEEPVTTINLSLSFGEASSSSQGRSPGSGFILLAAPSHPSTLLRAVALCGFRRHHSGGTAPDFHRFPYYPETGTSGQGGV